MNTLSFAAQVDALLPQTQCTRCGFPDCAAYAQAIATQGEPINQCPPGGAEGIARLAAVTGQPVQALNSANGVEAPRSIAVIDEAWCIGCTLCLDACPVDAIVGSNKAMHTVIESDCTGCELCIPACPVDCISLENATGTLTGWAAWSPVQAEAARVRYRIHSYRRPNSLGKSPKTLKKEAFSELEQISSPAGSPVDDAAARKRAVVEAAMAKARTLRRG